MYGIHSFSVNLHLAESRKFEDSNMLTNNVIAIDLAKNVLQVCHISIHGEMLSNRPLSRQKNERVSC
ncbi:COG3547 Transposase and inactivated derivatives [Vibrio sp. B1ASS3]|nr:COG3547 Transposase and inactivated derivatives [Vibrio sp. B1ASS3]CAE6934153.1 COG3547 Transposase and inactivated derivatives [Vibrio sp. B1ASS3]